MYDRNVAGQELTFGVSGKLIRNVLVMFDRETDTLWSQLLGKAVDGALLGTDLVPLASLQTTWAEWKSIHPETTALAIGGPAYDSYSGYYSSGSAGVIGEFREDDRLPRKELVHGIVVNGEPAAYPYRALEVEPLVNDIVDDEPVLVLFEPRSQTALAFSRQLGDRVLTFEPGADSDTFRDVETGSEWLLLTGAALSGPLAGESLVRIPGTSSFWFGWKDFYPQTHLWSVEGG